MSLVKRSVSKKSDKIVESYAVMKALEVENGLDDGGVLRFP